MIAAPCAARAHRLISRETAQTPAKLETSLVLVRIPFNMPRARGKQDHLAMCTALARSKSRLVCVLRVIRNVHRALQADYRFDEKPQSQDGFARGAGAKRANFRGSPAAAMDSCRFLSPRAVSFVSWHGQRIALSDLVCSDRISSDLVSPDLI